MGRRKVEKEQRQVNHQTGRRALSLTMTNNSFQSILTLVAKLQTKEQHVLYLHLLNHR